MLLDRVAALWGDPSILAVTIPYRGDRPDVCNADRLRLNAMLADAIARRERASAIDADGVFGPPAEAAASFEPDRLHLSREGYRRLTSALARRLPTLGAATPR